MQINRDKHNVFVVPNTGDFISGELWGNEDGTLTQKVTII